MEVLRPASVPSCSTGEARYATDESDQDWFCARAASIERGIRIGVISDIHYDLRPIFEHYELAACIDAFTLSFQHGCQKPDQRLCEIALHALGARPANTLMVGDHANRDRGAVSVGMTA